MLVHLHDVLERLASLKSPEAALSLRPNAELRKRLEELREMKRTVGWTELERSEWEQYEYVEHLVRMAKLRAIAKLRLHRHEPPTA